MKKKCINPEPVRENRSFQSELKVRNCRAAISKFLFAFETEKKRINKIFQNDMIQTHYVIEYI